VSRNKSKTLRLDIKTSKLACVVLMSCHVLAFSSVLSANIPFYVKTLLGFLVLVSFAKQGSRALLLSQCSIYRVYVGQQGVTLISRRGKQKAHINRVRYLSYLLTLLEFKVEEQADGRIVFLPSLILLPLLIDSISVAQRKDLHGFLNHSLKPYGSSST